MRATSTKYNALHEPESGLVEFRLFNAKSDFILATSNWKANRHMTDEEIERYYADREQSIQADFSEAIRMRF